MRSKRKLSPVQGHQNNSREYVCTAVKRGWCDANPVAQVEAPQVVEKQVPILTPQEIEQITTTAEVYQGGSCAAGWDSPAHRWPQDALRHTFASYHLSYFRSFAELQLEIGHRDATLLRTRYVDQRAVVHAGAFWGQSERSEDIVAA